MREFIIVYAVVAFAAAALMAAFAYRQHRKRIFHTLVSVVYALTLFGILFGMSVLEGKYVLSMLRSSILAALARALVCLCEYAGNRLAKRNGTED